MRAVTILLFLIFFLVPISAKEIIDLKVDLLENEILPDDPLRFQINVFRLAEKREDLYFEYYIESGETKKFIESESIAVEKIGSFVRTIELPSTITEGVNNLIVEASIKDTKHTSKTSFNILNTNEFIELPKSYTNYLFITLVIILLIFTTFLIMDYRMTLKLTAKYNKLSEDDL